MQENSSLKLPQVYNSHHGQTSVNGTKPGLSFHTSEKVNKIKSGEKNERRTMV
jgi:hypothetical protein